MPPTTTGPLVCTLAELATIRNVLIAVLGVEGNRELFALDGTTRPEVRGRLWVLSAMGAATLRSWAFGPMRSVDVPAVCAELESEFVERLEVIAGAATDKTVIVAC